MPRILIAGAGIGGLTTALALARAGIDSTIIERSAALTSVGAGVQLSPNATRILARLGVLDAIAAHALRPENIRVRGGRSGRSLALMPLAEMERRYGAPYLVIHRADLQAALYSKVAEEPGIALELGTTLAGFGTSRSGVSVSIKRGPLTWQLNGDGLIGADGIRSTVRARLVDREDAPHEVGRTAWRATVPADEVPAAFRAPETALWLGRDAHLVQYPLGCLVNIVAIVQDPRPAPPEDLWAAPGDPAAIQARFRRWHGSARDMIAAAPQWTTWPLFDRAPLAAWNAGPVALIGDAAHPILPFLAQGAAQAIEDAAAIAGALSSTRDIADAFSAYSASRRARALRVQEVSRRLGRIYHLGAPAAAARNAGMRLLGGRRLLARYDWLYGG